MNKKWNHAIFLWSRSWRRSEINVNDEVFKEKKSRENLQQSWRSQQFLIVCIYLIIYLYQNKQLQRFIFLKGKMQSGLQRSIKMQEEQIGHLKVDEEEEEVSLKQNSSKSLDQNQGSLGRKWSLEQNIRFIMFMDYYKAIFKCKPKRKSTKIYKRLAEVLPNRTSRQCRSRYQKIMKTFKNFTRAKKHFLTEWGEQSYNQQFVLFSNSLSNNTQLKKINSDHILLSQHRTIRETQKSTTPAQKDENKEERIDKNLESPYFYLTTQGCYPQGWYIIYPYHYTFQ